MGQEAIVNTLSNAIKLNRIAHAYLFTGPRGTGKTSTARILAKSLNCEDGPTVKPCGKCPSCVDIASGLAIDVVEIDAASNRKVEDARNLLEKIQFAPVSGKYKIYIIDEVHMLTTEAFNTLLKTLEEPPQNLVFILATTESHKVLNTIISRCQRFDFRRITQDLIVKRLKKIVEIENIKISDNALALIARRSAGGLRDALSLLDQASILSLSGNEVSELDIVKLLGSMPEEFLYKITQSLACKNSESLIQTINDINQLGNEPVQIIRELMRYFRNLMIIKTAKDIESARLLIDVSEKFCSEIMAQSELFEMSEIVQIIENLSNYEKTIKSSSQQHLWLELALISICHRHDIKIISEMEARISKLEQVIASGNISNTFMCDVSYKNNNVLVENKSSLEMQLADNVIEKEKSNNKIVNFQNDNNNKEDLPKKIVSNIVSNISSISGDTCQNWKMLLEKIESIPSKMFFSNLAKPVEVNRDRIVITFNVESFVKQSQDKSKLSPLEKAAENLFGKLPKIIARTPLPGDEQKQINADKINESRANSEHSKSDVQVENLQKIETSTQISNDIEEISKKDKLLEIEASDVIESIDDDVLEEIGDCDSNVSSIDIPEQAKLIVELFQGKVIE